MSRQVIPRAASALLAAVLALGTFTAGTPGAAADDPEHVGWTELLPPLPAGYEPTTENLCRQGQTQCVDVVIREMTRRFDPLAARCDHDAVFALTYLRTTEEYRRTVADPSFFSDTAYMNHLDVVFAAYYFDAYDAWHRAGGRGDRAAVPRAWQIAFEAADDRAVNGTGNLLLGMSAHVNRDLPFVLAAIGIVTPEGGSRKGDHDRVNHFLARVVDPVLREAAQRFDPTIGATRVDGTTLDDTALLQLLVSWREGAWRNAGRLVNAGSDAERAVVARSIEQGAALTGEALRAQTAYPPLLGGASARDAYCAEQGAG